MAAGVESGHAGHASQVSPGEIAIGVIIGRTSEFFDFFVYAIASVLVFPKFFSFVDALRARSTPSPSSRWPSSRGRWVSCS
jgi:hypothetical protein